MDLFGKWLLVIGYALVYAGVTNFGGTTMPLMVAIGARKFTPQETQAQGQSSPGLHLNIPFLPGWNPLAPPFMPTISGDTAAPPPANTATAPAPATPAAPPGMGLV